MRTTKALLATAIGIAALVAAPAASAQVQPYQTNDFGGFRNILPPGQGETLNGPELILAQGGTLPAHYDDQRLMYQDLVYATPGLTKAQIPNFFKDGSFGVQPADVERTYSPRAGVTVVRDNFGVPHIYGATRADLMFGAGYVGAEDRLFFMDVLRHAGRAQLSGFIGGANKAMDAEVWDNAPYKEQDLQRQIDLADDVYGAEGIQLRDDLNAYVAGVNKYISEAQLDPTKMPGEYLAIGKTLQPWKGTDVIATAALVGGIFGKGGGGELGNAEVYNDALAEFGATDGPKVWADFRRANDPEANTTVHNGTSFPYQDRVGIDPDAVAIQDPGSLVEGSPDDAPAGGGLDLGGILGGVGGLLGGSNALLVSGQESESGTPLAVFGPQVAYFSPQILMEQDMHGPDFDARGATFVGINLYVLLGRGQDYAWSATSAGQDIIDTFAEKLCEPGGGTPTINSMHYLYNPPGPAPQTCRPIEVLQRDNLITPNAIDDNGGNGIQTYQLEAQRTVHGIISKRGKVDGQPVAFAKLRSTYFHEADAARAFSAMNQPSKVRNASDFQSVMSRINFTFNWFYADDKDISYFNSGDNPERADGTDPEFPTWGTGEWDWKGWDPVIPGGGPGLEGGTNIADYTPFAEHPRVTNQDFITSWNNKQAPGFRAAEANYAYGPNHRSQSLDERIKSRIIGNSKMSLPELIDSMEDAGTVDLRGTQVLPYMLRVLRSGSGVPPGLGDEVDLLQAWASSGAHRRDRDESGTYDDAQAVQIMDAWWPLALEGSFKPTLGDDLFNKIRAQMHFDDAPGVLGSAYIDGWYGYLQKDLRNLLNDNVQQPFSRKYCGGGTLSGCKAALLASFQAALAKPRSELYDPGDTGCLTGGTGDDQMCHDAVNFRAVGGAVDDIHWINRPTWQQVVEIEGHRSRGTPLGRPTAPTGKCAHRIGGNRGRNNLRGTEGGDRISGKRGNDRLRGAGGDDCLNGGKGKDRVRGEAGDDIVRGGNARDKLNGGAGTDLIKGGAKPDRINALDGEADVVRCGKGRDRVRADAEDTLRSCEIR